MSTISIYGNPLSFLPKPQARAGFLSRVASGIPLYSSALRIRTRKRWSQRSPTRLRLAAARTYRDLTARGMPHEAAVEAVFDRHLNAR